MSIWSTLLMHDAVALMIWADALTVFFMCVILVFILLLLIDEEDFVALTGGNAP